MPYRSRYKSPRRRKYGAGLSGSGSEGSGSDSSPLPIMEHRQGYVPPSAATPEEIARSEAWVAAVERVATQTGLNRTPRGWVQAARELRDAGYRTDPVGAENAVIARHGRRFGAGLIGSDQGYVPTTDARWASRSPRPPAVDRLLSDNRVNPAALDNQAFKWSSKNGRLPVADRLTRPNSRQYRPQK